VEIINDRFGGTTVSELFGYRPKWALPAEADLAEIQRLMSHPSELSRPAEAPVIHDTATVTYADSHQNEPRHRSL
jgi:hypothetical protein